MRQIFAAFSLASILFLSGCETFKVKNTDGLALAYKDIDLAESKRAQLRTMSNITNSQRQQTADVYRDAKSDINAYLNQAITDASTYVVDKDAASYNKTRGHELVSKFSTDVDSLQKITTLPNRFDHASINKSNPVAQTIIDTILSLNNQKQKAAYDRFKDTINNNMMKNFEEPPTESK